MVIDGEEVIAIETDKGILCPSCWLQKNMENPDDDVTDYYITREQATDFIGEDYEACSECGCPIGGSTLSDLIGCNNEIDQHDAFRL